MAPTVKLNLHYTPHLVDKVIDSVSSGKTLRQTARELSFEEASFRQWVVKDIDGLASRYAHAREAQAEAWSDEISAIADSASDKVDVQSKRLQVDTKKWLMAKLHPRRYGDKITADVNATHSASDSLLAALETISKRDRPPTA